MHPVLRSSTSALLIAILWMANLTAGCKASKPPDAVAAPTVEAQSQPAAQGPQLSVDDLVAPIALYPDQLLAQVLSASMNPQEVLDGGNWIIQNQKLKGDALTNAAKAAGFSPSMQYLMLFPQVVDNMCQEMPWTTQLGQAFQADQPGVMAAVQRKRAQAQQAGNLASSPQMKVDTKTEDGKQYVEIQPADPKVVYVPQYNPVTIYNVQSAPAPAPAAAPAPTVVVAQAPAPAPSSGVSAGTAAGIGILSFGVGMLIGAAVANNNNYYPYPAWGHGVYYGGHPYYPPPYRPAYPGYHPAGGYYPPSNYQWNQANKNVNVNVNNNYYNQFNKQTVNNVNNRPGGAGNNATPYNRAGQGSSTYQGARPTTTGQKPGASMSNAVPSNQQVGNRANQPANAGAVNRAQPGSSMSKAASTNQQVGNRPSQSANAGSVNRGNTAPTAQPTNRGNVSGSAQPANRTASGAGAGANASANASRPPTSNSAATRTQPQASAQTQNRGSNSASSTASTRGSGSSKPTKSRRSGGSPRQR